MTKRRSSKLPCKIYSFRVRIDKGLNVVADQLRHARVFYNDLVTIENGRRDAYRTARSRYVPGFAKAESELQAIEEAIETKRSLLLSARAMARANVRDDAVEREIVDLVSRRKMAASALKPLREAAKAVPELEAESKRISALAYALAKNARAHNGAFWTTQGRVSDAIKQASKASRWRVKYRRSAETGTVGGQILKFRGVYLDTNKVFSEWSNWLQIEPLPADTWDTRSGRRHAWTTGRIRIQSVGQAPVWAELRIKLHRPLPPGCVIKNAWLKVSRVGRRFEHHLQMTIEGKALVRPASIGPSAGVAVGWERQHSGDVHVATLVREDGHVEHLSVPAVIVDRLDYCETLQGHSDVHFEAAKAALSTAIDCGDAPGWVAEECPTLRQWRRHARLHWVANRLCRETLGERVGQLWTKWRRHRLGESLDLFATLAETADVMGLKETEALAFYLLTWQRKDDHLGKWIASQRRRTEGRRDDLFRCWVAGLRKDRLAICYHDTALAAAQRRANPEEGAGNASSNRLARKAAPGRIKELLKESGATASKEPIPSWCDGLSRAFGYAVAALVATGCDIEPVRKIAEQQLATMAEAKRLNDAAE